MMADVYGMPVHRLAILEEATSMGAAVAGGAGAGLYPDFSMIETMKQVTEFIERDPAAQAAYEQIYPILEAAYQALVPTYDMIAETS
jgi:xylulokinase